MPDSDPPPLPSRFDAVYEDGEARRAVPVQVTVSAGSLVICRPDGREIDRWPLNRLKQPGTRPLPGAEAAVLRLSLDYRSPTVLAIADAAVAAALECAVGGAMRRHTDPERRLPLLVMGALASLVLLLVWVIPALAGTLVHLIPAGMERRLGDEVNEAVVRFLSKGQVCTAPQGQAALARIMERLVPDAGERAGYRVSVIPTGMANAFALPGGTMGITSGLIATAPSAEAVAGVIGHEIGHVVEKHGTERLLRASFYSVVFGMITGDLAFGGLGIALERVTSASYSREQELAADAFGAALLVEAGVPVAPKAALLADLGRGGGGFLSTHPAGEERARLLGSIKVEPGPPVLDETQWQALRDICSERTRLDGTPVAPGGAAAGGGAAGAEGPAEGAAE